MSKRDEICFRVRERDSFQLQASQCLWERKGWTPCWGKDRRDKGRSNNIRIGNWIVVSYAETGVTQWKSPLGWTADDDNTGRSLYCCRLVEHCSGMCIYMSERGVYVILLEASLKTSYHYHTYWMHNTWGRYLTIWEYGSSMNNKICVTRWHLMYN